MIIIQLIVKKYYLCKTKKLHFCDNNSLDSIIVC